jgi:hypothetical protein
LCTQLFNDLSTTSTICTVLFFKDNVNSHELKKLGSNRQLWCYNLRIFFKDNVNSHELKIKTVVFLQYNIDFIDGEIF